jgi:hypothetical protein
LDYAVKLLDRYHQLEGMAELAAELALSPAFVAFLHAESAVLYQRAEDIQAEHGEGDA